MEIYKNDYSKNEDKMMWELHEIRHGLAKEYESMTVDEINKRALEKYNNFLKKHVKKSA